MHYKIELKTDARMILISANGKTEQEAYDDFMKKMLEKGMVE